MSRKLLLISALLSASCLAPKLGLETDTGAAGSAGVGGGAGAGGVGGGAGLGGSSGGGAAGTSGSAGASGSAGTSGSAGASGNAGTSGSAGSGGFCATQTVPTGVATADFQCLDFEDGLPPAATWAPVVSTGASSTVSQAQAFSAPNSLLASVVAAPDATSQTQATLTWTDVGATPVTSFTLDARLNPVGNSGVTPDWTGAVDLLCITIGDSSASGRACLQYTKGSSQTWSAPALYTGLLISWAFVGGGAVAGKCQVTRQLTNGIWNPVELKGTVSGGALSVLVNGASAVSGCGVNFPTTTTTKAVVGPSAHATTSSAYSMYFDNVVAITRR